MGKKERKTENPTSTKLFIEHQKTLSGFCRIIVVSSLIKWWRNQHNIKKILQRKQSRHLQILILTKSSYKSNIIRNKKAGSYMLQVLSNKRKEKEFSFFYKQETKGRPWWCIGEAKDEGILFFSTLLLFSSPVMWLAFNYQTIKHNLDLDGTWHIEIHLVELGRICNWPNIMFL